MSPPSKSKFRARSTPPSADFATKPVHAAARPGASTKRCETSCSAWRSSIRRQAFQPEGGRHGLVPVREARDRDEEVGRDLVRERPQPVRRELADEGALQAAGDESGEESVEMGLLRADEGPREPAEGEADVVRRAGEAADEECPGRARRRDGSDPRRAEAAELAAGFDGRVRRRGRGRAGRARRGARPEAGGGAESREEEAAARRGPDHSSLSQNRAKRYHCVGVGADRRLHPRDELGETREDGGVRGVAPGLRHADRGLDDRPIAAVLVLQDEDGEERRARRLRDAERADGKRRRLPEERHRPARARDVAVALDRDVRVASRARAGPGGSRTESGRWGCP